MATVDHPKAGGTRARRRPSLVVRLVFAVLLAGFVLILLLPALVARGIVVDPWFPWAVVALSLVLFLGPALVRGGRRN
jgi:hypothetical protein